MTPNELYARAVPDSGVSSDLLLLRNSNYDHVPEVGYGLRPTDPNARVIVRCYKEHNFDGRRFWRICSVWFDSKPIMIVRNAGREGDDHRSRFVTDPAGYDLMVAYLQTLTMPSIGVKVADVVEPTREIPTLTSFYGNHLDGHF